MNSLSYCACFRQGVFSAAFEGTNNSVVKVEDGSSISLDCLVFLKQEKTVGRPARCSSSSPPRSRG